MSKLKNGDQEDEFCKEQINDAKKEVEKLGGWKEFRKGNWLYNLVQKSIQNYMEKGNWEYYQKKYKSKDVEYVIGRLTNTTAKNAAIIGGIAGASMSTNEIVAFFTAGAGGVGIPANIGIAGAILSAEALLLARMQVHLVINISKAYKVPLDPDDPEDILTILAYMVGGSAAAAAGEFGMNVGAHVARQTIRGTLKGETLRILQRIGRIIGVKILQRTIIKYVVPIVSILVGGGWNYASTKSVSRIARRHFKIHREDNSNG